MSGCFQHFEDSKPDPGSALIFLGQFIFDKLCVFTFYFLRVTYLLLMLQLIVNLVDMNDNQPMFPLSQYILRDTPTDRQT